MKTVPQIPGCLPKGFNPDSLLTVEQAAVWMQMAESTLRSRLAAMPGVIRESRESILIHPRTYLEIRLKGK